MSNHLHRIIGFILLLASTSLFAETSLPSPKGTPIEPLNGIVAVVNDTLITQKEYQQAILSAKLQTTERHLNIKDTATLNKQVLDQLIYQHLQLEMAANNHLGASKKEVNEAIEQIIQRSSLSRQAFLQKLTNSGISYADFRDQMKKQLIIDKLQHQALGNDVRVSSADISRFRKSHHLDNDQFEYHIVDTVVSLSDNASAGNIQKAKAKAIALSKSLQRDTSSDDADSTDLGWRTLENLPTLFVKPIQAMKPGTTSSPLQAANGFHIVQLVARKANPKAVTNAQVENVMAREKFFTSLEKWLKTIRASAYVHINKNAYDS